MKRLAVVVILLVSALAFAQSELIIVRPTEPVSLDPQFETTAPGAVVYNNILEPLITLNEDMEIEPGLATSWEFVEPNRLRFHLREGVTFHDGTPFNAEAVKFTWDRALFAEPPGRWASLAGPIEAVEVVDEYTVDIVAEQPYGPLLLTTTMVFTGVVSPTAVEKYGDQFGRHPVGTGPFKFVEWRTNDHIVLEANEDYWRDRPALDRIVFRVVPEDGARTLALLSGEAQMVINPLPSDLSRFEDDPNFKVASTTGLRVFNIAFNVSQPPVDDPLVRKAIHHAISVPLIVENILEGAASLPSSVISPGVFGYEDMGLLEKYPYDPERARELLEEAGYTMGPDNIMQKDGEPLVLRMLPASGRYLKDREIAVALQEFLRQVGIQIEMDIFEWATTFSMMREATFDYPIFTFGWLTTTGDADYTLYSNYHSEELPPDGWNRMRYSNPRVDELVTAARNSVDAEEREQLYAEVQSILAEELPAIPLYNTIEAFALADEVQGFEAHPIEYIVDLYPVSLEAE